MRTILLTTAVALTTATMTAFAGPALADMTLPVSAYPQAAPAVTDDAPAYYATVEQPSHFTVRRHAIGHERAR